MQLILLLATIGFAIANRHHCGYHIFDKIYDGDYTAIDEFPWTARLEYIFPNKSSAGYFCAGALISDQFVLTAAHCITSLREKQLFLYRVRLGEYDTNSTKDCVEFMGYKDCADKAIDVHIEYFKEHEDFLNLNNDIAIIKLAKKIKTTDFIRPICLPTTNNVRVGDQVTVAGWGSTENGKHSSVKLKVEIPVVPFWGCYRKFQTKRVFLDPSKHMCAGGVKGKDSCTGDSGSPLMANHDDGYWQIVGITSSGNNCGLAGWPGIYTRVVNYLDWIQEHIRSDSS